MPSTVHVKRGDVGRTFAEVVTIGGVAQAPAAPTQARFLMRQSSTLIDRPAVVGAIVFDADAGTLSVPLSYTTAPGDLDGIDTGGWQQEWELTWSTGDVVTSRVTWPADGCNYVQVDADLNPPPG